MRLRFCFGILTTGVLVIISALIPRLTLAAAITFNTALPVAEEEFVSRELLVFMRSGDDPSGLQRKTKVNVLVSVLGYGISSKLALFAKLPYFDKDLSLTMNGAPVSRSNMGMGDLSVFGRYTFYQKNGRGHTFRIAGFAGTKAPTGSDNASDILGRIPTPLQNSTGAWDGFGGVVTTWQTLDYEFDGQISYRNNGQANNFQAGNEWKLDGSLQYRLWPNELGSGPVPGFLYGVLESNLEFKNNNQIQGVKGVNSGGVTFYLSPGLQYVTKRWIVEAVIQKPVIQNLNGDAPENDYILRTGIRWNF